MEERTYDLTVPVTRQLRVLWRILGVIQIPNGLMHIIRGDVILGIVIVAVGLMLLMPFRFFMQRLNRYLIVLRDEHLEIKRGIYKPRRVPWSSISEIRIELMSVGFHVDDARGEKISFSDMGYSDNQTVKPQIISDLRSLAEAKGISITDH